MINLWLDDQRPAPEGWVHVKTVWEAIALIKSGQVQKASLDHDLGLCPCCERHEIETKELNHIPKKRGNCTCMTGYKLCLWMADNDKWPKEKPTVHSQNPVGAFAMKSIIDKYWKDTDEVE